MEIDYDTFRVLAIGTGVAASAIAVAWYVHTHPAQGAAFREHLATLGELGEHMKTKFQQLSTYFQARGTEVSAEESAFCESVSNEPVRAHTNSLNVRLLFQGAHLKRGQQFSRLRQSLRSSRNASRLRTFSRI